MSTLRHTVTVLCVLCLVSCGSVPVAASPSPPDSTTDTLLSQDSVSQLQQTGNNSTDHHDDPAAVSEDGDTDEVQSWLVGQLQDHITNSSVQISQGQYEQADSALGDEFDSRLEQFVDVAGETDTESDDVVSEGLTTARDAQQNYTTTAQEYNKTYQAYTDARRTGNETAARQYARELQALERNLSVYNQTLTREFEQIENRTGASLENASRSVAAQTTELSNQTEQVTEQIFTPTTLRVRPAEATIAYDDPLAIQGQLRNANGTAIGDESVTIQVHSQTTTVRTADNGSFSLQYRPRTLPVDSETLSVAYIPESDSPYLGSNDTVAVTVRQVEAQLRVVSATRSVSYDDRVQLTARLLQNGTAVHGMPLSANLSEYGLQPADTGTNGTATLTGRLPAGLSAGEYQSVLSIPFSDRAVTAEAVGLPVTVRQAETDLSVTGTRENNSVRLAGHLQTVAGTPIPDQPLQVTIAGNETRTVRVNASGGYAIDLPRSALPEPAAGSVAITLSFDGTGTNLESTSLSRQVAFEPFDATSNANQGWSVSAVGVAGLLGLVGIALGGFWLYRRRQSSPAPDHQPADESADTADDSTEPGGGVNFATGRDLLEAGEPDAAVKYLYQDIREAVSSGNGVQPSDTHWEFLQKCRQQDLAETQTAALEELIEAYEQTRFHNHSSELDIDSLVETLQAEWSDSLN